MLESHYRTLNIDDSLLGQALRPDLIKSAYRQALLAHHPDKITNSDKSSFTNTTQRTSIPTIDEISLAYQVLSDPRARAEYDKEQRIAEDKPQKNGTLESRTPGLEIVDLDDMKYDEQKNVWTRECRCGTGGGFVISEQDLEKAIDGTQSGDSHAIMVGCEGCSLSLKVIFAIAED